MNVEAIEQLSGAPTKEERRIFNRLDRVHDAVKSALGHLRTKDVNPIKLSPEEEYTLRGCVGETLVAIGEQIEFSWRDIQIIPTQKDGKRVVSMFSISNLRTPLLEVHTIGQNLPEGISKFAPSLAIQAVHSLRMEDSRVSTKRQ